MTRHWTKKSSVDYKLPKDFGHCQQIWLIKNNVAYAIQILDIWQAEEMSKKNSSKEGFPTCCCCYSDFLSLYPTPDKKYEIVMDYVPRIKKWK